MWTILTLPLYRCHQSQGLHANSLCVGKCSLKDVKAVCSSWSVVLRFLSRNGVYFWAPQFQSNVENLGRIRVQVQRQLQKMRPMRKRDVLLEKEKSEWQFNNGLPDIRNYYTEVNDHIPFMCKHGKRKSFSLSKSTVQNQKKSSNQMPRPFNHRNRSLNTLFVKVF